MGAGAERGAERHFAAPESVPSQWRRASPSPSPDLPGAGRLNSTLAANVAAFTVSGTGLLGIPLAWSSQGNSLDRGNLPSPSAPSPRLSAPAGAAGCQGRLGCHGWKMSGARRVARGFRYLARDLGGGGASGSRCPFPALPRGAVTCCALPRAVPRDYRAPVGHGGWGRVRTPNLKHDSDCPRSPHSHCPVPVPSSSPQPRHG